MGDGVGDALRTLGMFAATFVKESVGVVNDAGLHRGCGFH